ncbi:SWR1-complex protein 7 [Monosporozyma servazzii]
MLSELPSNIVLLLLQVILARQQEICRTDKDKDLEYLLGDPIIDDEVLHQFTSHTLINLYSAQLKTLTIRKLKTLVAEIFQNSFHSAVEYSDVLTERFQEEEITIVTLANFYYDWRVMQLEQDVIPKAKEDILRLVQ